MDSPIVEAPEEIKRLQGCINDLISIQSVAAVWTGSDPLQIMATLLKVLVRVLRLDFACARVSASVDGATIEVVRLAAGRDPAAQSEEVLTLSVWLTSQVATGATEIPNPIGPGKIAIVSLPLGLQDDMGLLVAAARRKGFPSELEIVLLRVAANQAVIGLQEARVLRRVEERLRRSEAQLADGQRLSRTGSWAWSVPSRRLIFSDEALQILGFDPDRPAPSLEAVMDRIHLDDRAVIEHLLASAIADKRDYEVEARITLPDGSMRSVQCVGCPFTNGAGSLEYVGALLDVTQRKRTEESLQAAEAQLVHVARVTTMGELAASIAHEVKQPLAAARMNASAGLHWLGGAEPNLDEARAALSRIVEETDRANQVVDRIRAFMKRGLAKSTTVAMNELIYEVLALTRHRVLKENVSLRTEFAADLHDTIGDTVQLQQVMINLIVNAIEATSTENGRRRDLLVSSENDGPNYIVISVRDSGIGIDPSRAEEIFQPFVTSKPGGMGMGLPISRSIVEAHGGRLLVLPNSDQGVTFRFSLPAK